MILRGMSGTSMGHHLGHVLGISGASSEACLGHLLGHVWDNIWGILLTMDNNEQQSAVLHASVMPFFHQIVATSVRWLAECEMRLCVPHLSPHTIEGDIQYARI